MKPVPYTTEIVLFVLVALAVVLWGRRPLAVSTTPQFAFASARPDPLADERLRAHLEDGDKVRAIVRYRELTGAGLKQAKDAVEAASA
ncbi:MAG: hypothetical protein AAF125_08130 [Chloroflexota bacterium]